MVEVTLTRVTKTFGEFVAVNDVSMVIEDGKSPSWWARRGAVRRPPCAWWPGSRRLQAERSESVIGS